MEDIVEQTKRDERAKIHAARLRCLEEREKARSETEGQTIPHTRSRIFRGHKILGHVTNHVPGVLRYVHTRRENFIVTCIGKSINTYASNQLSLLSTSGTLTTEISCMAGDTYHVYTASGNTIYAWRRGVEITHTYTGGHGSTIVFILPFGEHLISIDELGRMCMRDIKTEEQISTVKFDPNTFKVSTVMHPATYINKILLGSQQGTMQLWNVKKMKMIHLFSNWTGSSILHIEQAPAVDCVAVALSKKRVLIHNLRYDVTIMTLKCEDQPISIAFRTDNVEAMITGNSNGSITLWDLNRKEVLQHVVKSHSEPVTGLQCFHQEPIFFTTSSDNTLKLWILDGPGGTFRELCTRSGHSQPPGRIKFFGSPGYEVFSAGKDGRIRQFHIYNETINRAWGENKIPLDVCRRRSEKPNPIIDFTSQSVANMQHHDDIAILTEDEAAVTTWSSNMFKQGGTVLFPFKKRIPHPDFVATCLFLSSCGQFVVIGYDNGSVHRYNIQSGQHRLEYGRPNKAHEGTVRGVAIDNVNGCVASGGADNLLKIWKFDTSEVMEELTFDAGIASIFRHKKSNILGVLLDSFEISVVDLVSKNILREFTNVSSPVQDAAFSPDCRWLTASSADCLVRTWDLPTGNMIDVFRLESIVTYMDYSPQGEYLATALSDNIGILLWMNRSVYRFISLLPIPQDFEPPIVDFRSLVTVPVVEEPEGQTTGYDYVSPEYLDNDLITFSQAPEIRWKSLLHLDTIRERNKPKQPPKQHVAPFFLPSELKLPSDDSSSVQQPEISSTSDSTSKESKIAQNSKILSIAFKLSPFATGLLEKNKAADYHLKLCKILENMGPSQVESEILGLAPHAGGSIELMLAFITFAKHVIASKMHSDTIQAYLNVFLRHHADLLCSHRRFQKPEQELHKTLVNTTESYFDCVNEVLGYCALIKGDIY
ncbi:unnamed protein product [Orchesella dallaii]|uniref:WD repeat-containing protein 36 n=1 Tax=Orchesella dallaii TaxID=48710 RepID=A0ABP1PQ02_9HEXA